MIFEEMKAWNDKLTMMLNAPEPGCIGYSIMVGDHIEKVGK
jgi:hypothetical protein